MSVFECEKTMGHAFGYYKVKEAISKPVEDEIRENGNHLKEKKLTIRSSVSVLLSHFLTKYDVSVPFYIVRECQYFLSLRSYVLLRPVTILSPL